MTSIGKVIAVVLTYNRKELVSACLRACLDQTEPPDYVFVLDNGSTDGTRDNLRQSGILDSPRIVYLRVPNNIGPAAGFDRLIRLAYDAGCDWIWTMDDDVIPHPEALAHLKSAFLENFKTPEQVGFLSSTIVSRDGQPNNVPEIDARADPGQCQKWGELLHNGLVKIRWSTMCSAIFPRSTLARVGGFSPSFYFSGDDIDFTLRITEILPGYLVGKSVVTHLRQLTGVFSILRETDPQRIQMFFYYIRNNVYIRRRYYSNLRMVLFIGKCIWEMLQALSQKRYPLLRAVTIAKGILAGIVFHPTYRSLSPALTPVERASFDHSLSLGVNAIAGSPIERS